MGDQDTTAQNGACDGRHGILPLPRPVPIRTPWNVGKPRNGRPIAAGAALTLIGLVVIAMLTLWAVTSR